MAHNVYIYGLGPGKFRVPNPSGGWQSVSEKVVVQVDLDDQKTQRILWGERWHFVRVSASNSTTTSIIGLTRYGLRIPVSGTLTKVKLGSGAVTVDLTDPKVRRVLRRSEGRYMVATSASSVAIRGVFDRQQGFDVGLGAKATATLSSDGTNPVAGDTVTINDKTYRFESTLAQANDVKIGASSDATLDSLVKAVNQTGVVGTDYFTGTTAPTGVTAGTRTGTGATGKVLFTATAAGPAGNAFPSTDTSAHLSFGGTTFAGGGAGVGNSESQTPTKVYRGQTVTLDATQPFNYQMLRRHFRAWIES